MRILLSHCIGPERLFRIGQLVSKFGQDRTGQNITSIHKSLTISTIRIMAHPLTQKQQPLDHWPVGCIAATRNPQISSEAFALRKKQTNYA